VNFAAFAFHMKRTDSDRRFARRFAEALHPHVNEERDQGKSLAEIARKLGVTAAGLQKQLAGGTPSVRTVALAYAEYGVAVPYESIDISKAVSATRKRGRPTPALEQLVLPFEITAPMHSKDLVLKLVPRGVGRYRLQLTMAISG
jgi:transcriptional regulator with XRE-family HTH domain